jgi:vitamin B12 transporter
MWLKRSIFSIYLLSFSSSLLGQTQPANELEGITVTATRLDTSLDRSPSATTVITSEQIDEEQYRFATDALRTVPGLNMVQTGTPGQLTSAFIRGSRSDQTQVLLDGIPINQELSGAFNFADFTTDNLQRIEVIRGPQSALYGPRASGGVINFVTNRGEGTPTGTTFFEGGSWNSFRESTSASGKLGPLDFSIGASRFDTDNARQNNNYRSTSLLGDVGLSPIEALRIGVLFLYNYAGAASPNTITDPRPIDNLRTERWLIAPHIEFKPVEWWNNRFYFEYDQERQVNQPNQDGFIGPTRAILRRYQLEYQNDLTATEWLTITSGLFYSHTTADQRRLRPFDPSVAPEISDKTENIAGYGQIKLAPIKNLDLYASGRYDHFRQYGDVFTYRFAGNYILECTGTIFRSSYATGFTPPSSQDKIFGGNPNLKPDHNKGFDIGVEQPLWENRIRFGANFFYTQASNVIGSNSQFQTFNLGAFRTQGVELFGSIRPFPNLIISASYTYLDAKKTSSADINQPLGARLPRRPRQQYNFSVSYRWFDRLFTSVEVGGVNARQEINFAQPNINVEDYTVVRLVAELQVNPHFWLTGRIENLFDEKYAEVLGFPALGRSFYGGLKVKF